MLNTEEKQNSFIKIFSESKKFCTAENFSHFLITESTGDENYFSQKSLLLSDIPAAVFRLCQDTRLLNVQQPMHRGDESTGFLYWEHLEIRFDSDSQSLLESAGFTHAIGIPLPPKTGAGIALFFGRKDIGEKDNIGEIINWSKKVSSQLHGLGEARNPGIRISKRERECLLWTSQGKTSYEIGMILGLSENTINNYLATVGRKLGAFNRPHMVGLALRNGYIE